MMVTLSEVTKKMSLFLGETEIEEVVNSAIAACNMTRKGSYSEEEMEQILDAMIKMGGFAEFVARNKKIELCLKRG